MINIIVSQGRIADRVGGMIKGAAITAKAFAMQYGIKPVYLGTPSPARHDDWSESLPEAKETLTLLRSELQNIMERGHTPVVLNNTCSASLATLPVVAQKNENVVVLWIDAHGDFNLPQTSTSGYLGGMVLAAASGLWDSGYGAGISSKNVVLVGARDIDDQEAALLRRSGVRIVPPSEVSGERILKEIGNAKVWVHIDWDVMEPGYLPADYTVPGGLVPAQIKDIISAIPRSSYLGLEIAELNASEDDQVNEKALSLIIEMIDPFFTKQQTEY